MATVFDIYRYIDEHLAPFALQMEYDNAGFLVGRKETTVTKVLVSLDITEEVIGEASEWNCQLIVSHHPVIFQPVRRLTDDEPVGKRLLALVERHIAAICAHTNLDAAQGGVNDALADRLGLAHVEQLCQQGVDRLGRPYGIGRIGEVEGFSTAAEFAHFVQGRLFAPTVRLADAGRPVHKVAVGGGSCGDMWRTALERGCDTLVTADVKHSIYLDAVAMGLNLIDAGHFSTENVICPVLSDHLRRAFPDVEVMMTQRQKEVFCCG